MGNDGGSIPTRRELVKEAAKALSTTQTKEIQSEQQAHAWSHDPLTSKPLAVPVVSDAAGTLYNKDSVLEFLLLPDDDGKKAEWNAVLAGRVKGLKDVVEVKFDVDREGVNSGYAAGGSTGRKERWVCSVSGRELGPGSKACYVVPCGHAFAGTVVKEVSGETCLTCGEKYAENDVVPILPTRAEDIARLSLRAKTLREKGLTHALKKAPGSKKRKKSADREANEGNGELAAESKARDSSSGEDKKRREKNGDAKAASQGPTASNGIKNSATAALTKRVLDEQEQLNKRRKLVQNENVKSLFSSRDATPKAGNSADYMTRGFSIGQK